MNCQIDDFIRGMIYDFYYLFGVWRIMWKGGLCVLRWNNVSPATHRCKYKFGGREGGVIKNVELKLRLERNRSYVQPKLFFSSTISSSLQRKTLLFATERQPFWRKQYSTESANEQKEESTNNENDEAQNYKSHGDEDTSKTQDEFDELIDRLEGSKKNGNIYETKRIFEVLREKHGYKSTSASYEALFFNLAKKYDYKSMKEVLNWIIDDKKDYLQSHFTLLLTVLQYSIFPNSFSQLKNEVNLEDELCVASPSYKTTSSATNPHALLPPPSSSGTVISTIGTSIVSRKKGKSKTEQHSSQDNRKSIMQRFQELELIREVPGFFEYALNELHVGEDPIIRRFRESGISEDAICKYQSELMDVLKLLYKAKLTPDTTMFHHFYQSLLMQYLQILSSIPPNTNVNNVNIPHLVFPASNLLRFYHPTEMKATTQHPVFSLPSSSISLYPPSVFPSTKKTLKGKRNEDDVSFSFDDVTPIETRNFNLKEFLSNYQQRQSKSNSNNNNSPENDGDVLNNSNNSNGSHSNTNQQRDQPQRIALHEKLLEIKQNLYLLFNEVYNNLTEEEFSAANAASKVVMKKVGDMIFRTHCDSKEMYDAQNMLFVLRKTKAIIEVTPPTSNFQYLCKLCLSIAQLGDFAKAVQYIHTIAEENAFYVHSTKEMTCLGLVFSQMLRTTLSPLPSERPVATLEDQQQEEGVNFHNAQLLFEEAMTLYTGGGYNKKLKMILNRDMFLFYGRHQAIRGDKKETQKVFQSQLDSNIDFDIHSYNTLMLAQLSHYSKDFFRSNKLLLDPHSEFGFSNSSIQQMTISGSFYYVHPINVNFVEERFPLSSSPSSTSHHRIGDNEEMPVILIGKMKFLIQEMIKKGVEPDIVSLLLYVRAYVYLSLRSAPFFSSQKQNNDFSQSISFQFITSLSSYSPLSKLHSLTPPSKQTTDDDDDQHDNGEDASSSVVELPKFPTGRREEYYMELLVLFRQDFNQLLDVVTMIKLSHLSLSRNIYHLLILLSIRYCYVYRESHFYFEALLSEYSAKFEEVVSLPEEHWDRILYIFQYMNNDNQQDRKEVFAKFVSSVRNGQVIVMNTQLEKLIELEKLYC